MCWRWCRARRALLLESCIQLLELGWRLGATAEDAAALFAEGMALATRGDDPRGRAMLVSAHAALRSHFGSADDFVDSIRQAEALAAQTDDAALWLATRARLVIALVTAGRLREALPLAEAVLAEAPADLRLGATILGYSPYLRVAKERATLLIEAARVEEGVGELERAAALAHAQGDLEVLGFIHAAPSALAEPSVQSGGATPWRLDAITGGARSANTRQRWQRRIREGDASAGWPTGRWKPACWWRCFRRWTN